MIIGNIIKKELAVYHRVPGSYGQKTDLVNTLPGAQIESNANEI